MDDLDSFILDGFTTHFKNRKAVTKKRKSGGIAIAIRNKYIKYITILESESKLVYWFVVSKIVQTKEENSLGSFEVDGKTFEIYNASEHKCPRCWKFRASEEDALCQRCDEVVN